MRGDRRAGIPHFQDHCLPFGPQPGAGRLRSTVLDCVREEVGNDLLHTHRIPVADHCPVTANLDAASRGANRLPLRDANADRSQVGWRGRNAQCSFEATLDKIKQRPDQAVDPLERISHRLQTAGAVGSEALRLREQLSKRAGGAQWAAQIMADEADHQLAELERPLELSLDFLLLLCACACQGVREGFAREEHLFNAPASLDDPPPYQRRYQELHHRGYGLWVDVERADGRREVIVEESGRQDEREQSRSSPAEICRHDDRGDEDGRRKPRSWERPVREQREHDGRHRHAPAAGGRTLRALSRSRTDHGLRLYRKGAEHPDGHRERRQWWRRETSFQDSASRGSGWRSLSKPSISRLDRVPGGKDPVRPWTLMSMTPGSNGCCGSSDPR